MCDWGEGRGERKTQLLNSFTVVRESVSLSRIKNRIEGKIMEKCEFLMNKKNCFEK